MCVVRGDGGGRLHSGLISVPGSDSASLPGPTGEDAPSLQLCRDRPHLLVSPAGGGTQMPHAYAPNLLSGVQWLSTLPCSLPFWNTLAWPGIV